MLTVMFFHHQFPGKSVILAALRQNDATQLGDPKSFKFFQRRKLEIHFVWWIQQKLKKERGICDCLANIHVKTGDK